MVHGPRRKTDVSLENTLPDLQVCSNNDVSEISPWMALLAFACLKAIWNSQMLQYLGIVMIKEQGYE